VPSALARWDQAGDDGADPAVLSLWRRVVEGAGMRKSLTQDLRDQAQAVALGLARASHRRRRRRQYAGVVRLVLECLAVVVAVRGLAGHAWPDAVLVALGVMLADLTLLAAAAALPPRGVLRTIAQVLIESVTAVLPIRAVYHRRRLRVWLADRLGPLAGAEAMRQLDDLLTVRMTPGRTRRGLFLASPVTSIYNLATEQFLAEVDFRVEYVPVADRRFAHVVDAFTGVHGVHGVHGVQGVQGVQALPPVQGSWSGLPDPGAAVDPKQAAVDPEQEERDRSVRLSDALNQLQAWLTDGWQRHLRLTACWLSGGIAVALDRSTELAGDEYALFLCVALVLGGSVAELVRVLMAARRRLIPA
jgi:hypothetical protein